MYNLIVGFLSDLINNSFLSTLEQMDAAAAGTLLCSLKIEVLSDTAALSAGVVSDVLRVLYGFMLLLLALKLIWKGYKVYILNRDGEAEASPLEMLQGAVLAVVVAVIFPTLYDYAVQIVIAIMTAVENVLPYPETMSHTESLPVLVRNLLTNTISSAIIGVIFAVVFIILWFRMLMRGAEMLVYRMGIPFAVYGLVDSDGGVWKAYIQLLFKQIATSVMQYFLLVLGVRVAYAGTDTAVMLGIALMVAALSAPKLMAQIFAPSGGGGGFSRAAGTVATVVRVFAAG